MFKNLKLYLKFLSLFFGFILLVSCSKVTQSNFDKVQIGMTMEEAVAILGEPTTSQSIDVVGVSGASATWKGKNGVINIQFLNNSAQIKNFNKNDHQPT